MSTFPFHGSSADSADPVRRARAFLVRVAEPPAPGLAALITEYGPVDAAERVRQGNIPAHVADETRIGPDVVDDDFAAAAAVGARLLTPEDHDWPWQPSRPIPGLLGTSEATNSMVGPPAPPIALWVRGELPLGDVLSPAIAMVGTRAATPYGEHVAGDIAYQLALHGIGVVSDASYGIGGAALRGALNAGGHVIAVLANGIDITYPSGHTNLLTRVSESGLVITEHPPGTVPSMQRFLARFDRLTELTAGTVIVEASPRSGSRRAALASAALGRPVMAIPGPITSTQSLGTHALLRARAATPVASAAEILETLGIDEPSRRRPTPRHGQHRRSDRGAP